MSIEQQLADEIVATLKLKAHMWELVAALEGLVALYAKPGESNMDRFERVATMFYLETGCLAPGKDEAAASGGTHTYEERVARWEEWYAQRAAKARAALASVAA